MRLESVAAIVLAGGKSRRMGRSKAHLEFEGEPLLTRVVSRLATLVDEVVVVAQSGQDLPRVGGARVLFDAVPNAGPLVGLATGLLALAGSFEWAWVCATDAPFIEGAVLCRLFDFTEGAQAVVPVVGDKRQVLTAFYRTSLGPRAQSLVDAGERRASLLSDSCTTRFVTEAELFVDPDVLARDPLLRTFLNLNEPSDYLVQVTGKSS